MPVVRGWLANRANVGADLAALRWCRLATPSRRLPLERRDTASSHVPFLFLVTTQQWVRPWL